MYVAKYLQGGQGNLSGDIVNNYIIPIPPLPEQQKYQKSLMHGTKPLRSKRSSLRNLNCVKRIDKTIAHGEETLAGV